jgi:hypothetical protein
MKKTKVLLLSTLKNSLNKLNSLTPEDLYCLSRRFRKGAPCVKGPLMNNLERFMSSLASKVVVGTNFFVIKSSGGLIFMKQNLRCGLDWDGWVV